MIEDVGGGPGDLWNGVASRRLRLRLNFLIIMRNARFFRRRRLRLFCWGVLGFFGFLVSTWRDSSTFDSSSVTFVGGFSALVAPLNDESLDDAIPWLTGFCFIDGNLGLSVSGSYGRVDLLAHDQRRSGHPRKRWWQSRVFSEPRFMVEDNKGYIHWSDCQQQSIRAPPTRLRFTIMAQRSNETDRYFKKNRPNSRLSTCFSVRTTCVTSSRLAYLRFCARNSYSASWHFPLRNPPANFKISLSNEATHNCGIQAGSPISK
jgi:hypothetical protein